MNKVIIFRHDLGSICDDIGGFGSVIGGLVGIGDICDFMMVLVVSLAVLVL